MMMLRQLFDRESCTYTYLIADDATREALLIDPVFEHHQRDLALLRELDLRLTHTLDTHCHADHVTGAWLMKQALGSQIVISKATNAKNVDIEVEGGDTIRVGDTVLEVRSTPGHTSGCVTYVTGGRSHAFTGDCLLIRGAGRTDFQEGSAVSMYSSIHEQIFTLPDGCLIYPGHDYLGRTVSSVGEEKRFNARIGGGAREVDFVGYMENLGLAHPRKIDIAVPANLRAGATENGEYQDTADWGPIRRTYAGIPQVDAEWVSEHRTELTLLDVREPAELTGSAGVIEGTLSIPLGELRDRLSEIPTDRPVIAICHAGARSGMATTILTKGGHQRSANLLGGMIAWQDARLPLRGQSPSEHPKA